MKRKTYILNTNHKFPFNQFDKTWTMYYPGYEGFYAIADDGYVLSLERAILKSDDKHYTVKQRLLKPLVKTLRSNGKPKTVTINQTLRIVNEL